MSCEMRAFRAEHHASALRLWKSTEGVGLSRADSFENVARFLERNPGSSFALLVFRENETGRAFLESVGGEERVTLTLFSMATAAPA